MNVKEFLDKVAIAREGEEPGENPVIYIDGDKDCEHGLFVESDIYGDIAIRHAFPMYGELHNVKDFMCAIDAQMFGRDQNDNPLIYIDRLDGKKFPNFSGILRINITGIAVDGNGGYIVFTDAR